MRYLMIAAAVFGFAGTALAANAPTAEQCKKGWKTDYAKMWTKADFKTACASMKKM